MDAGDGSRAVVVVLDGHVEVVVGRIVDTRPDLAVVDALARLQLAARRVGCSIRVHEPSRELYELLDLVGLAHLIAGRAGLPLEAGRKAEGGEQLGVQEAVERGDAPP